MEFFNKFFAGSMHELDNGEFAVLCPFPHTNEKGEQYFESVPSAHINERNSLFHCKVCGKGMSEAAFLSKMQGISYKDSLVLLEELKKTTSWDQDRANFLNSTVAQVLWQSLGLSSETSELLQIGTSGEGVEFPIFIYGELLDIRTYRPGHNPKVKSEKGAKVLLTPFDIWRKDERPTLLCAGEKDMSIARQMGFNALTFTGGEQAFPKLFKATFRDKEIYITYDNDQAGREGSRKVASLLRDCGAIPHVVVGHYEVCTNKGEDIHDFFIKYGKTAEDLQRILDQTPAFTEEEYREEQNKYIPLVTITEAMKGRYANRLVSSRVAVTATYEESYHVPEYVELLKTADDNGALEKDDKKTYALDESNIKDILRLMDSNLKEDQIKATIKVLSGMPPNEKNIRMTVKSRINIFKAVVTDDTEAVIGDDAHSMRELLVYSVGEPIKAGQKYRIYYKPVGHPLKGQQIIGIVTKLEDSDSSINRFTVTPSMIDTLKCFQQQPGQTVKAKMQDLFERSKGIIGVEARKDVMFTTDLFFHTPLEFYFGKRKERATLDVMMVGDPRTGKSQAAKKLLELYELGLITSLKTTTKAGLTGGSDQTAGGWKTKLGLIPRNHKGAIVLEEFSGGGQELIKTLTEIRSSGRVRLDRVNGHLDVPALVRMLSISNPATLDGTSRPLKNYPHGIQVLLDLIGASEDIARYDFFLLVDEPKGYISPLDDFNEEPYPEESYKNRIRWVWSRKPEQIILDRPVLEHIVKLAEELNKKFDCHIKLFGPEAWKKLSRISIAVAGMLCSMDETGEKLVVKEDHVTWAYNFMRACYDNDTFKLTDYVDMQRKLVECDAEAVHALQGMYRTHAIMLKQLEMSTEIGQRDLQMMSGIEQKEFTHVMSQLVSYGFVQYGAKVVPTMRFRSAMRQIDTQTYMPKVGERR